MWHYNLTNIIYDQLMVLYKTTDDDDDDDDNNWTNGRTDWMSQAQAIYSSHSIIQAFNDGSWQQAQCCSLLF